MRTSEGNDFADRASKAPVKCGRFQTQKPCIQYNKQFLTSKNMLHTKKCTNGLEKELKEI